MLPYGEKHVEGRQKMQEIETQEKKTDTEENAADSANATSHGHNTAELKKGIKSYLHSLFDIRGDMMSHEQIDLMMDFARRVSENIRNIEEVI